MTAPGFMVATTCSVTKTGAGRPGINAVVMTMSCLVMCSATTFFCLAKYAGGISLA